MARTRLLTSARTLGGASQQMALADVREALRASVTVRVLDTAGLRVDVSCPPLFARSGGQLMQAVRLRVRSQASTGELHCTLRGAGGAVAGSAVAGDAVAGSASAVPAARDLSLDLLVPDVRAPAQMQLEITAGGQSFRAPVTVTPQRKWTVFVVHHSHLDIGYTDPQGMVARHHNAYLDSLTDLAAATDSWPGDARFRWTVEASWPLVNWLARRSPQAADRLMSRVREGRVEVTALPFNLHTEACSTDELYQLLRTAGQLRSRYGIPITSAMQTDVPGAAIGLVDALAGADVGYLSVAHNWAGRSVPFRAGGQELERLFYWAAPSGSRVLVWHTDTAQGMAYMEGNLLGLADDYAAALHLLPAYLQALASRGYPMPEVVSGWPKLTAGVPLTRRPYQHDIVHLRVQGAFADNAAPTAVPAAIAAQWNQAWAYPRLRIATNHEFFEEAEQRLAGQIPTYHGDWSSWWADGIGSAARALGYSRRAQALLTTAETMHAAADMRTRARTDVTGQVDQAGGRLALFDEHTWGAGNPWDDGEQHRASGAIQWSRKLEYAHQGYDDASDLLEAGTRRLGESFGRAAGALASILVLNTGAAGRTDIARVFVPAAQVPPGTSLHLTDARDGTLVPHREQPQDDPDRRPAGRYLEFVARDVPSVGFIRVEIAAGPGTAPAAGPDAAPAPGGAAVIENERYRVTYAPADACISSVVDKAAGRELVSQDAAAGFNQYLYERYATAPHVNHLSGRVTAEPSLLAGRSVGGHAAVTRVTRDAVGEVLEISLQGEGTQWITTAVSLARGVDRVDITNRIAKQPVTAKESAFFCFPFAIPAEPAGYELTGGTGAPGSPSVPGAARHMRAIRHWVGFEHAGLAVGWATLEAPLVQFGTVHLPYAPFPPSLQLERAEPATIYSWVLNNIWDTNFPAQQQGEMTFRYAIASNAGVRARHLASVAADSLTAPFVTVLASGPGSAPADGVFCTADHPGVRVAAIGRSRTGHDFAIRLLSAEPGQVRTRLRLPGRSVRSAWAGSYLEQHLTPAPVTGDGVDVVVPAGAGIAVVVDLD